MAAKDYKFYPSALTGHVYLAKKTKSKNIMSQDRRIVTDNEAIGIFELYLNRYCKEHNTDTINVSNSKGQVLFTATLKKKDNDTEN